MDLVFKRYPSPFFLDMCIENGQLSEFVDGVLKKRDDDMLWEMYLATLPHNEKSFNNWRQEILKTTNKQQNVKIMSKKEIDATIKKSQEILSGFKPPQQKGGI